MKKLNYDLGDWRENQARLDHYNQWLMDPKREFTSVYPGYPGDKNKSYSEFTERPYYLSLSTLYSDKFYIHILVIIPI